MKKKNKRIFLIIIIAIIALFLLGTITYLILNDKNKLSVKEKEWIAQNINSTQNIYVLNNVDIYGKNGSGVLFDFIKDFEQEFGIDINIITYNSGENVTNQAFKIVDDIDKNQIKFSEEHYVIISKTKENISSLSQLSNKKIGVLSSDEKRISNYLNTIKDLSLTPYETSTNLFEALETNEVIQYAIIPLEEHLSSILTSNYNIDYHISDLKKYLVYEKNENELSSIIEKYFNPWQKKNFDKSFNDNELKTFVSALNISDKDLTSIQAKTYNYGFINNNPYEVLISGTYGGIVSEYISSFSDFSLAEFSFSKYKNFNIFTEAIANNKIDLFYNYYNLETEYQRIDSLNNISFNIVAREDDDLVVNSINSLTGKNVYVLKNSLLEKYLNSIGNINIKTYANDKDLKKISKKDNIIIMIDELSFDYYRKNILLDYNIRYRNVLSDTYNFYISSDETFSILFSKYIQTLDPNLMQTRGIHNHTITIKSGTILGKIAKYSLIVIVIIVIILLFIYRSSKKIKIAKKIKKEDKMKYIDQLTSLKNRNYLNENISNWNKNTIYPQATIIIDLNQVQEINDSLGYEQGDSQIKATANILIKTQLDNSDIMRTDGNEFLIYLVGYQEKQIVSYIRKLNKEFKTLPYEYGAAIGYSMIVNDMKTIEDAINESVEDMKSKKIEQADN